MFLYLSKLLPLLVYPLSLACVLLILLIALRRLRWVLGLGLAAFLLLWLGGGEEPQALPQTFSGLNDVGNRPTHCGVPAAWVGGLSHDSDNCYFATQGRMT